MQIEELIRAIQEELGVAVDGKAGPETWAAIYKRIFRRDPERREAPALTEPASPRSEKVIATLQPEVQPYARALYFKARAAGVAIEVISGLRTYAEQEALYAKGRTAPGPVVTNVRGGHSNHNFGIAFDIGVFEGTRYLPESPKYKAVGVLGVELGLEWGGNWKSFKDEPHYQLRPTWAADLPERQMLAGLRERVAAGTTVFA